VPEVADWKSLVKMRISRRLGRFRANAYHSAMEKVLDEPERSGFETFPLRQLARTPVSSPKGPQGLVSRSSTPQAEEQGAGGVRSILYQAGGLHFPPPGALWIRAAFCLLLGQRLAYLAIFFLESENDRQSFEFHRRTTALIHLRHVAVPLQRNEQGAEGGACGAPSP
jgi:hypothetical protein